MKAIQVDKQSVLIADNTETQVIETDSIESTVITEYGGGGPAGKSAYEIALDNGFVGTQEQWLEGLKAGAEISLGERHKIMTNDGTAGYWTSIEDALYREAIVWDLHAGDTTVIQFKRGDTQFNDSFVGYAGEITLDLQAEKIRVHDGVTPGGHSAANMDDIAAINARLDGHDDHLATVDGRLDSAESRLDGHDNHLSTSDGRLDSAETRLDTAEGRLDGHDTHLATNDGRLDGHDANLATHDGRLDNLETTYIQKNGSVAFTGDINAGGNTITNVAAPVNPADATNKNYVDTIVGNLGDAFSYEGEIAAGATTGTAYNINNVTGQKDRGSYYRINTAGYVTDGITVSYVNVGDAILFSDTDYDVLDHTNTEVFGTTNFIFVTGDTHNGYTIDIDQDFKDRVVAAETKLAGIEEGAQVNVPTNLDATSTATTYSITSSTGNNTQLDSASQTNAGVMSSDDKTKLDGIEDGAMVNTVDTVNGFTGNVNLSTTNIGEGVNLYYTDVRVRNAISASGDLSYDALTGDFFFDETYSTPAEVKAAYEANADTNAFNDFYQNKLDNIEAGAEVNVVTSVNGYVGAVNLDADYDYYNGWSLWTDGVDRGNIASAEKVEFIGGDDITLTYNATGNQITIDSVVYTAGTGITQTGSQFSLTDESYTLAEKNKLAGIAANAEVNVQSDWNAISGDAFILNKPTLGTAAATDADEYATAAQGANADTAYGWGDHGLAGYEFAANKGVAGGYASLGGDGKVPADQLPSFVDDVLEYADLASFPATGETGKIYVALDTNKAYRWSGSTYVYITSGAVDSVNGYTGVINLVSSDVPESGNLYYTNARARNAISVSGDLSYNSSTGVISFNETYSTPQELFDAIITVDGGSGNGLNADTLDDIQSTQFLRSDQDDTMTAKLDIHGGQGGLKLRSDGIADHTYMEFYARDASINTRSGYIGYPSAGVSILDINNTLGNITLNAVGDVVKAGAYTIWHEGNQGAGSGMDADTVDGMHASEFATASHSHLAGDLPANIMYEGENVSLLTNDANYITALQAPVQTVAGRTGDVVLSDTDISGLSDAATTSIATIQAGTTQTDVGLSNVRNVASYSQTEADGRFVNVTGDDMTGSLRINTADDGVNDLQVGGGAAVLQNAGFGASNATEKVDVNGNARIRNENQMKFGGSGTNDSSFAIQYNANTNSLDFNFIGG